MEKLSSRIIRILCGICFFVFIFATAQAQWISRTTGLPPWHIGTAMDASDSNTAVISIPQTVMSIDTSLYRTVDGGMSWTPIGGPVGVTDVSMVDSSHIWASTEDGKIFATTNGGQTWTLQYYDSLKSTFMNYVRMFDVDHGVAMGDGIAASGPALFVTTTDGGNTWISKNDSAFGGLSSNLWAHISFVNPNVGYFFEMGVIPHRLYKTTTGGAIWAVTNYPHPDLSVVAFYSAEIGMATGKLSDQTVYRTLDGGTTWESFPSPRTGWGMDIEFAPGDPSMIWIADESGQVFFSADTGGTWTVQLSVGGNHQLRDLAIVSPTHGWLLGDDGRVYRSSNGGDPPVAVRGEASGLPHAFALEQNYPNPFNPETVVRYRVPVASDVKLVVYDLLGREVTMMVNDRKEAGSYEVKFDGTGLASGVYFYRLQAGYFVQTQKLILLR